MTKGHGPSTSATRAGESRALWDGRLRRGADEAAVGCAGFGRCYNRWLYRIRAGVFRRATRSLRGDIENLRVLDVGSGTGFYIEQWRRLGVCDLEGLDFSATGVEGLRQRFPGVPFHHADLGDPGLDLRDGGFHVISAFDVLFHIVDDDRYQAALRNLAENLRPGGLLLLSENFVHHRRPRVSDYHYSRTLTDIERFLGEAGLVLERRRPVFVLMNAPDDSRRPAAALWWRAVSAFAQRGERLGWLAGACLYPFECILTSLLREGPSTELAVCRRVPGTGVGATT